ncbi:hypothetical protein NDU88_001830 [Pleurodeles waltl]|uniref:Reverse transcriptase domain-containing protein n=1 Tax=Pleurodeles waltl TaxID=8319 RepID=A0AAV7MR12_PLEWA|nr:hypothetical protein NDU88_001830 [Pleurodeles waltl]
MEEAFDSLRWDFLCIVMASMGLGSGFLKWTDSQSTPTVRTRTGGVISAHCMIEHGNLNGCPLQLVLFTMALVPLAFTLRTSQHYQEIVIDDYPLYIYLYLDDLLLYLRAEHSDMEDVFQAIEDYSHL